MVDASSVVPGKIELPAGMGARAGQLRMEQIVEHFDALRPDLLRLQNEGNAIPLSQLWPIMARIQGRRQRYALRFCHVLGHRRTQGRRAKGETVTMGT